MAKARTRLRRGNTAVCRRCGAPGNPNVRGAQLVPMKGGIPWRYYGDARRTKAKQHADPKFCQIRAGDATLERETPEARVLTESDHTRRKHRKKESPR